MSDDKLDLLRLLVNSEWLDVKAMPIQNNRNYLLDVLFLTPAGWITVSGKAQSINEWEEAFSLDLFPHQLGGWWSQQEPGTDTWLPRSLKDEWQRNSMKEILSSPREARFFTDPRLANRLHTKGTSLEDCSAIEFLKTTKHGELKIFLIASNRYPCAVEYGENSTDLPMALRQINLGSSA